jgi:hypothetical protein
MLGEAGGLPLMPKLTRRRQEYGAKAMRGVTIEIFSHP